MIEKKRVIYLIINEIKYLAHSLIYYSLVEAAELLNF